MTSCRGYLTWVIILALIGIAQLFGFFEKVSTIPGALWAF